MVFSTKKRQGANFHVFREVDRNVMAEEFFLMPF